MDKDPFSQRIRIPITAEIYQSVDPSYIPYLSINKIDIDR